MKAERSVCLNGLVCHGFIGVYEEERRDGGDFQLDIMLSMPCRIEQEAVLLQDTVNYEVVLAIVKDILSQPEYLLETVANRIVIECRKTFPMAAGMSVHVQKLNPPMLAKIHSSSVKLEVRF